MEEADATRGVDTQRMDAMGDAVDQVGIGSGVDQGGSGGQSRSGPANPVWCGPQVHAYQEAVVAVFPDAEQAEAARGTLQQAGLAADQVGLAARSDALTRATGLLAALSAAEQDLFDALVELGIPPDAARLYQQSFEACQAIVAVRSGGRSVDLARVLQGSAGSTASQPPIDARAVERQAADRAAETGARGSRSAAGVRARRGDRSRRAAGRR